MYCLHKYSNPRALEAPDLNMIRYYLCVLKEDFSLGSLHKDFFGNLIAKRKAKEHSVHVSNKVIKMHK